jgi:iron complex transport system permease protein
MADIPNVTAFRCANKIDQNNQVNYRCHMSQPAVTTATLAPRRGALAVGLVLLALCVALALLSLAVGARSLTLGEVASALLQPDNGRASIVVWQLRMPRTLLAILAGAAMAAAGALMQALSRNALADPGLVGINAGAAFSVVIAIAVFRLTNFAGFVWFALAGSLLASLAVYLLSLRAHETDRQVRLVLAGVAVSASLGAMTGIITMLDATTFDSFRFWVVGAVGGRDASIVLQLLPLVAAGGLLALVLAGPLNALAMGDDIGRALGLPLRPVLAGTFLAIALLAGGATAAVGPIAFVGLVVPHLLRLAVGPDWRRIVPLTLLAGPALLLASDIAGRVVAPPGEVEAGIVTAFFGAPMLLWLVSRRRKSR